jgi:hypothetical protein
MDCSKRACFAFALVGLLCAGGMGTSGCRSRAEPSAAPGACEVGGEGEVAEFFDAMRAAVCEARKACCESHGAILRTACPCIQAPGFLPEDQVQLDPINAEECLAFVKENPCKSSSPFIGPCDALFYGPVQPGGQCQVRTDCFHPPGGSADCEGGWCRLRGALGDPCYGTCSYADDVAMCFPDGAPTAVSNCHTVDGLYCDPTSKKCAALIPVGGSGCADSPDACLQEAYCDMDADQCVARGSAGSECSSSEECADKTYCDSNVCVPGQALGGSCSGWFSTCAEGTCQDEVCTDVSVTECGPKPNGSGY